jgi:iron complex outermembrane recepter protein
VPDTVQSFSAKQLASAGVTRVNDLEHISPNLSVVEAQQPGVVLISVRGVGQVRNGEAPVAVVVDGVQQNSPNQITQDLFDIEHIELLKGPQGALYGRNAIGGAINIVTKGPTSDLQGYLSAGWAEGDEYTVRGALSGPLIPDVLGFRLAASYVNRDGQIENLTNHQKVDFNDAKAVHLALVATPTSKLKLDFRASYFDQLGGASWYRPEPRPNEPGNPIANIVGKGGRKLGDVSLKADYALPGMKLTSISSFSSVKSSIFEDLDWLPSDLLAATQYLDTQSESEEVRLASDNGDPKLSWLTGLYYLHTDRKLDTTIYLRPDLTGDGALALPPTQSTDHNDAYAVFGQVIYKITPEWELTGALRYDVDQRRNIDRDPPTPTSPTHFGATFSSLQPKVSLSYRPTARDNLYATISKGFRSGGFNANAVVTREFKQEELWNYELGYKTSRFDNRLYIDTSVFYEDIQNRQVFGLDLTTAPDQFIANPIPRSHVVGLELEFNARPVRNLEIDGGFGLMTSRIDSYDQTVFAGTLAKGDFRGNQLPQIPTYTVNLAVQYRWKLPGESALTLRAEESGSGGDYYWEVDNKNRRADIFLSNARLTYEHGPWSLTVFGKNLFDRRYDSEYVGVEFSAAVSGNLGQISQPRQFGVMAKLNF